MHLIAHPKAHPLTKAKALHHTVLQYFKTLNSKTFHSINLMTKMFQNMQTEEK